MLDLYVLDGMPYSFDHPALSRTEQDRARMRKCCVVLSEMLDSHDLGPTLY